MNSSIENPPLPNIRAIYVAYSPNSALDLRNIFAWFCGYRKAIYTQSLAIGPDSFFNMACGLSPDLDSVKLRNDIIIAVAASLWQNIRIS